MKAPAVMRVVKRMSLQCSVAGQHRGGSCKRCPTCALAASKSQAHLVHPKHVKCSYFMATEPLCLRDFPLWWCPWCPRCTGKWYDILAYTSTTMDRGWAIVLDRNCLVYLPHSFARLPRNLKLLNQGS